MKNKRKTILLVAVFGVVAVSLGLFGYLENSHRHSAGVIRVSGNIEATDIRLSFQVAGKIAELLTDEGKFVHRGDIVARLDKEELLETRQHEQTLLDAAKLNYNWLKDEYNRAENLSAKGAMTAQQRDAAKSQLDISRAQLDAAGASLQLADIKLGYTDLKTPVDGFILVKSAEAGEVVQPGSTVFAIADLNDIWLTAYVNETDLGKIRLDQPINVKTDTYPDKIYKGRISFISQEAEFTPKHIQTTEERVKLVYRIKVSVENPNFELKPGMPADGYIYPQL